MYVFSACINTSFFKFICCLWNSAYVFSFRNSRITKNKANNVLLAKAINLPNLIVILAFGLQDIKKNTVQGK